MAHVKEKTIDELLRVTVKLSEPRPSCVLEGKAKMRGPGCNNPSDDGDFGEVCENCKKPIHHGELSTCGTCERGFHATCLRQPFNASLAEDRLCKQCHELSSLQQRPSEASSNPSAGAKRRKSTPSKADSLTGRQDLMSKGSAHSSSQDTSQQGSKSVASENDLVKNIDSLDRGHSYVGEAVSSFISEDSGRSKSGRGETSEQSLALEPVRRSKRGRPYKPVGGLHPNKRRSVDPTSRHCEKGVQGRSRASIDEEDELGVKIEKFRGLKDLSSGNDDKGLKLALGEEKKASIIGGTSLSEEPQAYMAVKIEDQIGGKCGASLPDKFSPKHVEKEFEGDDAKNSEGNDTAVENCDRRTGKITPVGRLVERCAEETKLQLRLDDFGNSPSAVELMESLPATRTLPLKSEKHFESVSGPVPLDHSPQASGFENRVARDELPHLTRRDTPDEDYGQPSISLPVGFPELSSGRSDNSGLVTITVSRDLEDDAVNRLSKPGCSQESSGLPRVGQDALSNVFKTGDTGGAAEGRNVATISASEERRDGNVQLVDSQLPPYTEKSKEKKVAAGVEVGGREFNVADQSSSVKTQELTQHSLVVKSAVEESQVRETVFSEAPLPALNLKDGVAFSNCAETVQERTIAGEGKSSKGEQSTDIKSSCGVSHILKDVDAIPTHSAANPGNACVEGASAEASFRSTRNHTVGDVTQPSSLMPSTSLRSGVFSSLGNRELDSQILQQLLATSVLDAKGQTSVAANPEEAHDSWKRNQEINATFSALVNVTGTSLLNNSTSLDTFETKSPTRGIVEDKTLDAACKGPSALSDEEAIDAVVARLPKGVGVEVAHEASTVPSPSASKQAAVSDSKLITDRVGLVSSANFLYRSVTADSEEKVNSESESVKETIPRMSTTPTHTSNQTHLKVHIPRDPKANFAEEEDVSVKESENAFSMEDVEDIKVCDICGDPGYEECLAVCSACNEGAEHIYCMQALLVAVPVDGWMCEVCKAKVSVGNTKQGESQISNQQSPTSALPGSTHVSPKKKSPSKGNTRLSAGLDKGKGSPQKKGATKGGASNPGSDKRPGDEVVNPVPSKKQVLVNAATPAPGTLGSAGRVLSREGSFKSPDSGKVKFLSPNALASIPVGGGSRNSGKSTGLAGPVSHLSRPGSSPIGQSGSKNRYITTNSDSNLAGNKLASPVITPRSSAFPLTSPSPLSSNRGTGLQRSNESAPSFMRSASMKGIATPRAGKEASEGNGLPRLGRDSSSGGGNVRGGTISNSGKLPKGSPFSHGAPEHGKWGDTPRCNPQSSGSGMRSPRSKGDFGSGFQPVDTSGLSPGVERLKAQRLTSNATTSAHQQAPQASQFYKEGFRSNQETDDTSRSRQDEKRCDSPNLPGSKSASYVNLQSAKTLVSKVSPSTSEPETRSVVGTGLKDRDSELAKLELRPPGADVGEALRSIAIQKSASRTSDEERRLSGSLSSKVPPLKESVLPEDPASSPKGLQGRPKDVKRKEVSEGCWSALKNTPTMGSTRCYKCKEWGHTAQSCSNRSSPSSNYLEVGSTIGPSPLSTLKLPRETLGGASFSILKGPRSKLLESTLPGVQSLTGGLSISGAPLVSKPVSVSPSSTVLSETPADLEQTILKSSAITPPESTSLHGREELPRQAGTPVSNIHVRKYAKDSNQSSQLATGVSAVNVVTKAVPCEPVRSDLGIITVKDSTLTQASTSKPLNQVTHLAPVLTQSGISSPGVSTGNFTPALGVESTKPETESAMIDYVPRNCSKEMSQASHVEVNPLALPSSIPGASLAVGPLEIPLGHVSMVPPFSGWQQQRCLGTPDMISWGQVAIPVGTRPTSIYEGICNQDTNGTPGGSMNHGAGAPGPPFMSPGPAAVPEAQCLWSGGFEVVSATSPAFYDGLEGFASSFAIPKVREVTKLLPPILQLEEVRRMLNADAWPKQYRSPNKPPTDKEIALYFFPGDESSGKSYCSLVEHMVVNDLVLMGQVERAEILIFPSNLLAADYHRWKNKLFLWAVYRAKRSNPVSTPPSVEASGQAPLLQPLSRPVSGGVQMAKPAETDGKSPVLSSSTPVVSQIQIGKQVGLEKLTAPSRGDSEEVDMEIDMIGDKELGVPERPARKSGWDQASSLVSPPLPREPAPVQPPPPGTGEICLQDGKRSEGTSPKDVTVEETCLGDLDVPPGFGPPPKQVSPPVGPHGFQNAAPSSLQIPTVPVGPPRFDNAASVSSQKQLTVKPMEPVGYDGNQTGPSSMPVSPPPIGPPPFSPPGFGNSPVGSSQTLPLSSIVPPGFEKPASGSPVLPAPPGFDSSVGGTRSCESLPSGPPEVPKVRDGGLAANPQVNSKGDNSLGNGGEVDDPEKNTNQQHECSKREKGVVERRPLPYSRQASPMLAPSPSSRDFNEDSGFGPSRGSAHRISRSSSRSPTRYRDRTRDSSAGRPSYHGRDRGREKDRDRGRDRDRDRDRDRGRDRDRDRDRERDREKDRLTARERDKFKGYRYKDRVDRPRDSKCRRHARSRSRSPSRSRSRSASKRRPRSPSRSRSRSSSRRRPRSPSVSPRKRRSAAKFRSKHRSRSYSESPDSNHGRPARRVYSTERLRDSREQSNEGSAVVRRVTPRIEDHERDVKSSGEEARNAETFTETRQVFSEKTGKQAEGVSVVSREEEYRSAEEQTVSPVTLLDMNGPEVEVEEEKSRAVTTPYFHVFLSAESSELLEVDANEEVAERPFFPKGLPSSCASSSTFELLQKHTATETFITCGSWEEEKTTDSSGYQFFPLEVGRAANDTRESETNPNLELGLGGKDRKSNQNLVEPLPLFVLQDAAESSPDVIPCRFIEPPGFSSAPSVKEESQNSEANFPLNLTLAVPQYRKEGNSWVKVDDTEATLGEEDVDFALTL